MDTKAIARKIREAVYDRANDEGGAISKEQMEDTIGRVLAAVAFDAKPDYRSIIQGGTEKTVNA